MQDIIRDMFTQDCWQGRTVETQDEQVSLTWCFCIFISVQSL